LEVWRPELDRRDGAVRFEPSDIPGARFVLQKGATDQVRRFRTVNDTHMLVTVHGEVNTAIVSDLSLVLDKPFLPLPFTGGKSEEYWREHRDRIKAWFGLSEGFAESLESTNLEGLHPDKEGALISGIVKAVFRGIRKCLVLMPFTLEDRALYDRALTR